MSDTQEGPPFAVVISALRYQTQDSNIGRCFTCNKEGRLDSSEGLKQCNGCNLVRYCNRTCQKRDWKYHKEFCKYITEGAKLTASSESFNSFAYKALGSYHPAINQHIEDFMDAHRIGIIAAVHFALFYPKLNIDNNFIFLNAGYDPSDGCPAKCRLPVVNGGVYTKQKLLNYLDEGNNGIVPKDIYEAQLGKVNKAIERHRDNNRVRVGAKTTECGLLILRVTYVDSSLIKMLVYTDLFCCSVQMPDIDSLKKLRQALTSTQRERMSDWLSSFIKNTRKESSE